MPCVHPSGVSHRSTQCRRRPPLYLNRLPYERDLAGVDEWDSSVWPAK
jgi:hypothetical protein